MSSGARALVLLRLSRLQSGRNHYHGWAIVESRRLCFWPLCESLDPLGFWNDAKCSVCSPCIRSGTLMCRGAGRRRRG
ncbi:hypothetical protein DFP72DRAFT_936122 [Ephemerocybe angulata]|uniref:Uncharacterized protein n=1 Tax=Ephemerocybe angulata TaxID=980116 RepID=A0A8H6HB63_9AGAR|nr:hypothetical protein DFP72DRAFT_936122 [Tulosesus angulatus]